MAAWKTAPALAAGCTVVLKVRRHTAANKDRGQSQLGVCPILGTHDACCDCLSCSDSLMLPSYVPLLQSCYFNTAVFLKCRQASFSLADGSEVSGLHWASYDTQVAEQTPLTGLRLGELALEAGFPPGVLNVVTGGGADTGSELVAHRLVDKVCCHPLSGLAFSE